MSARIRVDSASSSQLAYCDDCPPWRELRAERAAALTAAADHAEAVHSDTDRARELRQLATRAARRTDADNVRTTGQDY